MVLNLNYIAHLFHLLAREMAGHLSNQKCVYPIFGLDKHLHYTFCCVNQYIHIYIRHVFIVMWPVTLRLLAFALLTKLAKIAHTTI